MRNQNGDDDTEAFILFLLSCAALLMQPFKLSFNKLAQKLGIIKIFIVENSLCDDQVMEEHNGAFEEWRCGNCHTLQAYGAYLLFTVCVVSFSMFLPVITTARRRAKKDGEVTKTDANTYAAKGLKIKSLCIFIHIYNKNNILNKFSFILKYRIIIISSKVL